MSTQPNRTKKRLRLLQVNLNKSEKAHLELYNSELSTFYDIILVQEPYITPKLKYIRPPNRFRSIYPVDRITNEEKTTRSVIWVSTELSTGSWNEIAINNNNDLTGIQLNGEFGRLTIFNIYNDCNNMDTIRRLRRYLNENQMGTNGDVNEHMMWVGDFNCHSPLWDNDNDVRLFTTSHNRRSEEIIRLAADYAMEMALPKGIPTIEHMVTKRESRTDNVWASSELSQMIMRCNIDRARKFTHTDHYSIVTDIDLPQERIEEKLAPNFRAAVWSEVHQDLEERLTVVPLPETITDEETFNAVAEGLTRAIQQSIKAKIKLNKPSPHSNSPDFLHKFLINMVDPAAIRDSYLNLNSQVS